MLSCGPSTIARCAPALVSLALLLNTPWPPIAATIMMIFLSTEAVAEACGTEGRVQRHRVAAAGAVAGRGLVPTTLTCCRVPQPASLPVCHVPLGRS